MCIRDSLIQHAGSSNSSRARVQFSPLKNSPRQYTATADCRRDRDTDTAWRAHRVPTRPNTGRPLATTASLCMKTPAVSSRKQNFFDKMCWNGIPAPLLVYRHISSKLLGGYKTCLPASICAKKHGSLISIATTLKVVMKSNAMVLTTVISSCSTRSYLNCFVLTHFTFTGWRY